MSASTAQEKHHFTHPPRVLVIGAGSRGTTYAQWTKRYTNAVITGICEPIAHKRRVFLQRFVPEQRTYADKFIAPDAPVTEHAWAGWREWVVFERARRERAARGEEVQKGVDAVFVCVLDEMHAEVVCTLAKMGVHVLVEKPLSTRLESCVGIFNALRDAKGNVEVGGKKDAVFGICHVLRYSAHNMLLRELVREKEIIGDVLSVEHVEPVGWWHFSHSYVRFVGPFALPILSSHGEAIHTNTRQRQLAQRVEICALAAHKVMSRHRLPLVAALLAGAQCA
jgi:predicted dehydrogenase